MTLFEKALSIALAAHLGQIGHDGREYVRHVLRVAAAVSSANEELIALLHDVPEKSNVTIDQLRAEGFPFQVVDAVDALTRRDQEDYLEFVKRAASNPSALPVKIADLRDNLAATEGTEGAEKYERALQLLGIEPNPNVNSRSR
ncbi:HD domain-containing protein [Pseudaminobacter soli (ex Li et al. 2025)]|uniref:Metal-dependent phosphohydrolase n=1 Tax=Pseudaminobacter soli (ex Li et al. 2025) TaxID=1295366 RepID=A0A2P7S196_9HYPH|nr:HD domain-containing protein [Mesorhizobium soli]PSJ56222.1 hypothetical protein C7I85_24895 [Mesorhizobium soli]